jgi:hypothetical protein
VWRETDGGQRVAAGLDQRVAGVFDQAARIDGFTEKSCCSGGQRQQMRLWSFGVQGGFLCRREALWLL